MDKLQFWHWFLVAAGFGCWSVLGRIAWLKGPCLAGLLVGLLAYLFDDISWVWQVWVFVMVSVLGAIVYLRREVVQDGLIAGHISADRVRAASEMVGKWAILQEPLPSGQGKIPIEGRFWQVETRQELAAGARVLVVGHRGPVLQLRQEQAPAGDQIPEDLENAASADVPDREPVLSEYQRSAEAEMLFGKADMDYWSLFREALRDHSKLALVYAYHLLCHLRGIDLETARQSLNTYTLALYDSERPGQLMDLQPRLYSDPRTYAFLYGEGRWRGRQLDRFHREVDAMEAALETHWAEMLRDQVTPEQVAEAVIQLRLRQVSVR